MITGNMITLNKAKTFATIKVTYPEGATCTATNGTVTLTAPDTSGECIFKIVEPAVKPEVWTVNCTNGIKNATKNINIIEKK